MVNESHLHIYEPHDANHLKQAFCIKSSKNYLYKVRRYLETGEAINWVADELGYALLAAMEAWILSKHIEMIPQYYTSWHFNMRATFLHEGPEDLRSEFISCLAKTTYLELALMGSGLDDDILVLPIAEWKIRAFACLEKAEKLVGQLFTMIEANDEEKVKSP